MNRKTRSVSTKVQQRKTLFNASYKWSQIFDADGSVALAAIEKRFICSHEYSAG